MAKSTKKVYPLLTTKPNKTPNKFYAVPIIGIVAKCIILIPVFIEAFFLGIYLLILWIINSFIILFTGNYWEHAYEFFIGMMNFTAKITLYIYGISDTYPGFDLSSNKIFALEIEKPKNPSRLFAFPIFGLLVRIILLIPFLIFSKILQNGSGFAMIYSWFPVLSKGSFSESTYEFQSASVRVQLSTFCFFTGLADSYPSFSFSMKNKTVKIVLLIIGTLMLFLNLSSSHQNSNNSMNNYYQNNYNSGN